MFDSGVQNAASSLVPQSLNTVLTSSCGIYGRTGHLCRHFYTIVNLSQKFNINKIVLQTHNNKYGFHFLPSLCRVENIFDSRIGPYLHVKRI